MFTLTNSTITFTYALADLRQHLQQASAQLSLTLPSPNGDMTATDAYAVTDDETDFVNQLLGDSAITASDEFDKIGQCTSTADALSFSAPCDESFSAHAAKVDHLLQEWLVNHTLSRWLRFRHLDADANQVTLGNTLTFVALHRSLFALRN